MSEQRRFATVSPLADLKAVRVEHAHTINDVVLAVISGGLRTWLLTRGESVTAGSSLTALVPMSVTEEDGEPTSLGSQVAPHLQSLPIGEPNALMRLHQVAYATQAHKDTGRAVGARSLSDIAGFAPTTLHALGVRVSAEVMRKPHDIVITNVPGPQVPLYAAGARLVASYPVLPLSAGHLLTIGVTSYNGEVFFGLTADRDAISDLDVLAQCLRTRWRSCWTPPCAPAASGSRPARPRPRRAGRPPRRRRRGRRPRAKAAGQKRAAVRNLVNRPRKCARPPSRRPQLPPAKKARPKKAAPRRRPSTAKKAATTAKKAPAKKAPAKKAAAKKSTERE